MQAKLPRCEQADRLFDDGNERHQSCDPDKLETLHYALGGIAWRR